MTLSDETIDTLAEIYIANRLSAFGVTFGEFVALPGHYKNTLLFGAREAIEEGFRPLLPRQAKAQLEADFQETLAQLRDDLENELDHLHHVIGPRRQSQAVRICDGRAIQPTHPRAIAGERCTRVRR